MRLLCDMLLVELFFFVKQKTAYEMRISDWSSDVCSSDLASMPIVRLVGNAVLSFFAKLSTGYWQSFDPNNGYVAIHAEIARRLPLHKIDKRYFFETDLLFRLNTLGAKVVDIPMPAIYEIGRAHV